MSKIPDPSTGDQYPQEGHAANGRPACPSWCVEHSEFDEGGLIHYGEQHEAAGFWPRLSQTDDTRKSVTGEVEVILVNAWEPVSVAAAAELVAVLGQKVANVARPR